MVLAFVGGAACTPPPGPEAADDSSSTGGGATAGSSTAGSSTAGSSTDGSSADGSSTDGSSTDGGSTDGSSTDGSSTDGGSTDGGSTDGGSTDGSSTDGSSTDGGSTSGSSTDGGSTDGSSTSGSSTSGSSSGGSDEGSTSGLTIATSDEGPASVTGLTSSDSDEGSESDSGSVLFDLGGGGPPPGWSVLSDPTVGEESAYAIAVADTGVLVAGTSELPPGADDEWRVELRDAEDGTLQWETTDNWFANNNSVMDWDVARGLAVDPTGVYVVGQEVVGANDGRIRIEKRDTTTGVMQWSYTSNPTTAWDGAVAVDVDAAGVYVASYRGVFGSLGVSWAIHRLSPDDGSPIWSVNTFTEFAGTPSAIAVHQDGVYVVGDVDGSAWRIDKRSLVDGSSLWSVTSDPSVSTDVARGVAVDASGVYIVGRRGLPNAWRIEKRSHDDGTLLAGFGSGGVIDDDPSAGLDQARAVAVDADGLFIVGDDLAAGSGQWRIERRDPTTGALQWELTSDLSPGPDRLYALDLDGDYLYVAGTESDEDAWRIERRLKSDGSL